MSGRPIEQSPAAPRKRTQHSKNHQLIRTSNSGHFIYLSLLEVIECLIVFPRLAAN